MPLNHWGSASGTQKSDPYKYLHLPKLRTHTSSKSQDINVFVCCLCTHLGMHLDITLIDATDSTIIL